MRVKRGVTARAKHKKIFAANKGYRMTKRRLIKVAKEAYNHAGEYAFQGRRQKKRDFRATWISRISQAVRGEGMSYSVFAGKLKAAHVALDRKVLAWMVREKPEAFKSVVDSVK